MKKNELRKLRTLNVTPGMLTALKEGKYDAFARAQCLGQYVKIAFFAKGWLEEGIKTPICETFLNGEGKEWTTRIMNRVGEEAAWSEAMIYNLPFKVRNWYMPDVWVTQDTWQTIKRFTGKDCSRDDAMRTLWTWQEGVRAENIREKERKEQEPWDKDMALVPDVPKGLEEWMHRQCNKQFFLVYKYKKNQKEATCTRCGSVVSVEGLKNNVRKMCPACHAKAICKSEGRRMHSESTDMHYARVIQKIEGGIVERLFERRVYYDCKDFRKPGVYFREIERVIIPERGEVRLYDWTNYKGKCIRWVRDEYHEAANYRTYGRSHGAKTYPPTMREAKKTEILKKSSYGLWKDCPLALHEYIVVEKGNPAVEMLARIGMFTMAEEMIRAVYDKELLNEEATELTKILKIDGARLKRLRKMEAAGLTAIKWMQLEKVSDEIWPDQMIEDFGKANVKPQSLYFIPPADMTVIQKYNYLKRQKELSGEDLWQLVITWSDYYSMAGTMKMDVRNSRIFKPKDLLYAHEELIAMKNTKNMEKEAEKIEKKWPKVSKQLEKLGKYEFKLGKYQIVAPKKVLDIVREGRILQHCVHTCEYYFSRISTDESYLFFLRKTAHPDMPWYTLEAEPSGNIRQKRTTGDRQNKDFDDAVEFLKKWQQHFKKQLTKEEKKLGIKADELRKKNYKELREQAKKVWHGPLAGQLLADVLEADFMEAI